MKVAIHQPNFMPWAGYFYKILTADIFIFFDTVQFPRGKSYCSRVKIKAPEGAKWLTVPASGKGKLLQIKDVQISGGTWTKKHLGTLKACYGKTPYFNEMFASIENIYTNAGQYIADFNIQLISYMANILEARTKFIRASNLQAPAGDTGEYIINLVKSVGGSIYISGQGAGTGRYLVEQNFKKAGVKLELFNYVYPRYQQLWGDFVPGLSVVDILFNTGPQARDLILSGGIKE